MKVNIAKLDRDLASLTRLAEQMNRVLKSSLKTLGVSHPASSNQHPVTSIQ